MPPKRLGRPSGTGALDALGFLGQSPIDLEDKLRAVVELRPQRPEECPRYSIHRWWRRINIGAAGAGRFNGVWVGSGGVLNDNQAVHVIERVRCMGPFIDVRIGALPAFALTVIGGVYPRDNRLANSTEMFNGMVQWGDTAAITGVAVDNLNAPAASGEYSQADPDYVAIAQNPNPSGDGLLLWNGAANVALAVSVWGYTVLGR